MAISDETLKRKIQCFYKKQDKSYSFIFNDAMAVMLKINNGECTFSLSTEKKIMSKIKSGKNVPLETAIKKTVNKAIELSSPNPKVAGAIYLFMTAVNKAVKERNALFEWAEFIDPFLSEAASNSNQPVIPPIPPQAVIQPRRTIQNKTTINFKNPVK